MFICNYEVCSEKHQKTVKSNYVRPRRPEFQENCLKISSEVGNKVKFCDSFKDINF